MDGLSQRQMRILLAYRTVALSNLGRDAEADKAYNSFLEARNGVSSEDYIIMPYLFARGRYEEVIRMNTSRRRKFLERGDSVNYHILTINRSIANAYMEMGAADSAAVYYRELAAVTEALKKQEQESSALELAAIYETAEKDREIERQKAELKTRNLVLVFMGTVIVLAVVFAVCTLRTLRRLRGKNKALAKEVSALVDCRQELYASRIECSHLRQMQNISRQDDGEKSPGENKNRTVWEEMEREIIEERLYLDPHFTRSSVMQRFKIPKNRFAPLFKENAGMNFSQYVNNLRLEHSVMLMKEKRNYTINAIAAECGFPNPSTFYRLFFERFSMTPSEYFKSLEDEA